MACSLTTGGSAAALSFHVGGVRSGRREILPVGCDVSSKSDCSLYLKSFRPAHPKGKQSLYSLEGLMLKLKLQYFGLLMQRIDSLEKTLMFGKIEGGRIRGRQRMRRLDGIIDSMDMS